MKICLCFQLTLRCFNTAPALEEGAVGGLAGASSSVSMPASGEALVDLDTVERKMELAGALFAILPAELVFPALELHHLLIRCLRQSFAPDRFAVLVVRHD